MIAKRSPSLERALQPQGGTVSDAELAALGSWAKPDREHRRAWAAHVRALLAVSPGRDLASAALEARLVLRSREDGPRRATPAQTGTRSSEAQRPATGHAGPAKGLYVTIRPDRAESAHSGTMGRRHG